MMWRRSFLVTGTASLAAPAIAAPTKTLIFVPQTNLTSLDPVWTTATPTRNFALMVYETLYGRDEKFNVQPLMVQGHVIDNDGLRWTMTLRDGLMWHDGTRVTAGDCLASLQRWLKREPGAGVINDRVVSIETPDDRTIVWKLRKKFPLLTEYLSKVDRKSVV